MTLVQLGVVQLGLVQMGVDLMILQMGGNRSCKQTNATIKILWTCIIIPCDILHVINMGFVILGIVETGVDPFLFQTDRCAEH